MTDKLESNLVTTTEQSGKTVVVEHETKENSTLSSKYQLQKIAEQFALTPEIIVNNQLLPLSARAERHQKIIAAKQQQNREAILQLAVGQSAEDSVCDKLDLDWFCQFLTFAEQVSNKTLQELWAKILMLELEHPNSFSIKTLKIFKSLSINEAKILAKVKPLVATDSQHKNMRIITGAYQKPSIWQFFSQPPSEQLNLAEFGLNYSDIQTLAANNLIYLQQSESQTFTPTDNIHLYLGNQELNIRYKKRNCVFTFYKLTPSGCELLRLMAAKISENYQQKLFKLMNHHFSLNTLN